MKQYGIRKVEIKNETIYSFFHGKEIQKETLKVGSIVKCKDRKNVHFEVADMYVIPEAKGNYDMLIDSGNHWAVVEYDSNDLVDLGEGRYVVYEYKIVHLSEKTDGLLEYFKNVNFDSETAYKWARDIGNEDYMIKFINEEWWAYKWARDIGDENYMRQFISTENTAIWWASTIGDKDYMYKLIKTPKYAYYWANAINEFRDYMRDLVKNDEYYAFKWACRIGDREYMRQFIKSEYFAYLWALNIGDREYMRQFVKDPTLVQCWNLYIDGKESCDQTDK